MTRYEYKVIFPGYARVGREGESGPGPLEDFLNLIASEGWRYKTVIMAASDSYLMFEREIVEATDDQTP